MAAKKAARYVTAAGTTYAPGDEVPAEVVEQINNPSVWKSDEDLAREAEKKSK